VTKLTYDTVASFSQVTSLLMFVVMFIAVVAYALWPRNRPRFERAQRRALDLGESGSDPARWRERKIDNVEARGLTPADGGRQ
jgi:cytochrome c oxidase cbb3-type subunit IV